MLQCNINIRMFEKKKKKMVAKKKKIKEGEIYSFLFKFSLVIV